MEITRHFTATTYIVFNDKVLLHLHKKLGCLLPVGGHIDRDELPEQAAIREVKEECGLDVLLHRTKISDSIEGVEQLHMPMHLLLEDINPHHQHIDFIYYAKTETDKLIPEHGEMERFMWLTQEEVNSKDMPPNVRMCALEALQLLKD